MTDRGYRPNVGVMLVQNGRVWVGERLDTPGAWQMPQGGIDAGEDACAAALRELEEETGVTADLVEVVAELPEPVRYDLPPDVAARLWKGRYRGQEQRWFLLRFLGRDEDVVIAQPHPEFSAWKWVEPQEMLSLIVPFKRDVYRAVLDGFAGQV